MRHLILIALFFSLFTTTSLWATSLWASPEKIKLYTYHNHPPFVTGDGKGLSFDVEKLLNKQAQGRIVFNIHIVPRSRLNVHLMDWIQGKCLSPTSSCDKNWGLLWVNQKWGFGKNPDENFGWVPILKDSNAIISSTNKKITYDTPDSLIGHRFGGIRGHRYIGIDSLVKNRTVNRIDGNSERDNIIKLIQKRVDVILLPASTIHFFISEGQEFSEFSKDIYIAPKRHQSFSRNFMFPPNREDLKQIITKMLSDPTWQQTIKKYGFK